MNEIVPLPAATVTLVRDAEGGLQVLMLQRNFQSGFMPGMYLFPGGALDAADCTDEACACCSGLDDATASGILGVPRGGLAYWIAAVRESFEEAGVLLACDARGGMVSLREPALVERYRGHRHALNAGELGLRDLLATENLRIAADRLVYFSHWITPVTAPRRYDTRFFLAVAPAEQEAQHDNHETIAHVWVRPQEALDLCAKETLNMRTPTIKTLERFAACATSAELIAEVTSSPAVRALLPRMTADGRSLLPGDPGYEDQG